MSSRTINGSGSPRCILMNSDSASMKRWQAEIWSGKTSDVLAVNIVYGHSLEALREAAREFLIEHRPACFSNLCPESLSLRYSPGLRETTLSVYQVMKLPKEPSPVRRSHVHSRKQKTARSGEAIVSVLTNEDKGDVSSPDSRQEEPLEDWCRMNKRGWPPIAPLGGFKAALESFVRLDLLPARGPDYAPATLGQQEGGFLSLVQTVQVTDEAEVASHMLQRGWILLDTCGKETGGVLGMPGRGHVLFVMGHPEVGAT